MPKPRRTARRPALQREPHPLQPEPELPFARPEPGTPEAFRDRLQERGLVATVRWSRGVDGAAACGQLRLGPAERAQRAPILAAVAGRGRARAQGTYITSMPFEKVAPPPPAAGVTVPALEVVRLTRDDVEAAGRRGREVDGLGDDATGRKIDRPKRCRPFELMHRKPLNSGTWADAGPAMKMPGWSGRLSAVNTRSLAAMLFEPLPEIDEAEPVEFTVATQ